MTRGFVQEGEASFFMMPEQSVGIIWKQQFYPHEFAN